MLLAVGSIVAVAVGKGAAVSVAVGSGSATSAAALVEPVSPQAPVSNSADETSAAPTANVTSANRTSHSLL